MIDGNQLNTFLEGLLDDGGMSHLEPAKRQRMVSYLKQELEDDLLAALIPHLQNGDIGRLENMVAHGYPPAQIQRFLLNKVPDVAEVVAEVMLDFRTHYVSAGA